MNRVKIVLFLLALGAGACARRADQGAVIEQSDAKAPRQLSPAGFSASAAIPSATAAPTVAPGPRVTSSLKLIRTASLQVEVASFRTALEEASRAATAFDGYVSDRQSSEDAAGRVSGQITLSPSAWSVGVADRRPDLAIWKHNSLRFDAGVRSAPTYGPGRTQPESDGPAPLHG